MDRETRARVEAAGFRFMDAEDFLGLTPDERRMVDLRVKVSRLVRCLREQHGLTQQQLARRMKSSQSRVAKIEAGEADVSLDLSFRALFAAGGKLADLAGPAPKRTKPKAKRPTADGSGR
jgi:DNA-binding XRE family transcriptional regulator